MKNSYFIFFLCLVVISCGRKPEGEAETNPQSRAFELERENFFTSLKKPDEVAALVTGVISFDATILHDAERFHHYADNNVKAAANLGVYMADLNYCILLKQHEASRKYFQAAYVLSEAIQIEKSVLTFLMIRYEKNMEQNDSIKAVVNQLFSQSTSGLQGTDRERLAGIAMAGYQIENLHLALTILKSFPDVLTDEQEQTRSQLLQFVLGQRGKFEVIYNFIRIHSDPSDPDKNPNYPFFDNALRELIMVYRNISETDPQVDELKEKIDVVRNKIVNL